MNSDIFQILGSRFLGHGTRLQFLKVANFVLQAFSLVWYLRGLFSFVLFLQLLNSELVFTTTGKFDYIFIDNSLDLQYKKLKCIHLVLAHFSVLITLCIKLPWFCHTNSRQLFCNCPLFVIALVPGLFFGGKPDKMCCHSVVSSKWLKTQSVSQFALQDEILQFKQTWIIRSLAVQRLKKLEEQHIHCFNLIECLVPMTMLTLDIPKSTAVADGKPVLFSKGDSSRQAPATHLRHTFSGLAQASHALPASFWYQQFRTNRATILESGVVIR